MSATLSLPAPTTSVTEESRAVLQKHGRSFALAGIFLPSDQLDDAAVAYAFCRLVDDVVDEAPDAATATRDVTRVRAELSGQAPARPVVAAYIAMAARRGFPLQVAHDLIDGCVSDLGAVRVADDEELALYCYRVAGTVGLMMSGIMGVRDPAAVGPAKALGEAMQLTNICRDVLEDTGRDRCYLPDARLRAAGSSADAVVAGTADPAAVKAVVDDLLDQAEAKYREAWRGMHFIPWRPRLAIHVALRVYRRIGVRLRRVHGGDPMHGRTIVPTWERLLMVGRGVLDQLFGAPEAR